MWRIKHFGGYIHQRKEWPYFTWAHHALEESLAEVRRRQASMFAKLQLMGFEIQSAANLQALSADVLKTSEIEGEILNPEQVRSSIARRLGLEVGNLPPVDRHVEGVVDMMLDATQNAMQALTEERLFGWHAALFPTGFSGAHRVLVAQWRDDSTGPMQVVSGGFGREKVHFEAPAASRVPAEMAQFFDWYNTDDGMDLVLKAAVAHFWFLTIHPFEDGNGRIARAIADSLLTRADGSPLRFYSMSSQIREQRSTYYDILERSQKASLDITQWMNWFLECLLDALLAAEGLLASALGKHHFWLRHAHTELNHRQRMLLNQLWDGFEGKLKTSKWAKIAKCSQDTAARDIQDLIDKGILVKEPGGGRSTSYALAEF